MKRRQLAAVALSAILSFSACFPATGIGVYAAENDTSPGFSAEETVEAGGSDEMTEAAGQAGESARDNAEETVDGLPEDYAEQAGESAQDNSEEAFDTLSGEIPSETDPVGEADGGETAAEAETESADKAAADAEAVSEGEAGDADPADSGTAGQEEASPDEGTAVQEEVPAGEEEETLFDGGDIAQEDAQDQAEDQAQDDAQDQAQDGFETVTEEGGLQEDEAVSENAAGDAVEVVSQDFEGAIEIPVGGAVDVNITGDAPAFFYLSPEYNGKYVIYSTSSGCNPAMILYDDDYNEIGASDDDSGMDFEYTTFLEGDAGYYIQAYCFDEQAEYQVHFEKLPYYARAAEGITDFHLERGGGQTLKVETGAPEGEEVTFRWHKSDGSGLSYDTGIPNICSVQNVQSYTQICCDVGYPDGTGETVFFNLYVNGVISAWPEGGAPDSRSSMLFIERGSSPSLSVSFTSEGLDPSIVWYDEDNQVLQDNGWNDYTLFDIQESRTIFCRVSDVNDPDNYAVVTFYININPANDLFVYPEGNERKENEKYIDITGKESLTLRTMVEAGENVEGITYKWENRKYLEEDWTEIPGIEGDTYEVSMPMKGDYMCTVTDSNGRSESAFFHLYLGNDEEFSLSGTDLYGEVVYATEIYLDADDSDGPVSLWVTAYTGVGDRLTYQWYKDAGSGEELIEGADNPAYSVDNPVNGTAYTCVVDNGYGDKPLSLTYFFRHSNSFCVYADAERLEWSVELDPRAAESFTLSPYVTADNMDGLTYEWKMSHSDDEELAPTGDTSASLTVSSPANGETYACTVTDSFGNSGTARYRFIVNNHLRVYAAEDPSKQNYFYIDVTGKETLTLNAVVEADEGTPVTYFWSVSDDFGDQVLVDADGASGKLTGGGEISLQVGTPEAGRIYECVVKDDYNAMMILSIQLVSETPALNIYPEGASEGEDTAVINVGWEDAYTVLTVNSVGEPDGFSYTWKNASGEIVSSLNNEPSYSLYEPVDGEKYSCTVTDRYGQEATVWFELHVERDPNGLTDEQMASARAIRAGETASVEGEAGDGSTLFAFTPEADGHYLFYSSHEETEQSDPYGELYDPRGSLITSDHDSRGNADFLISVDLTAGKTYYLKAQYYSEEPASYTVHVEATDFFVLRNGTAERTAYIGEETRFDFIWWSATDIDCQWYEGDADGTEGSFVEISGATGTEYSPVIEKDCSFMCRVSDTAGHTEDIIFYITAQIDRNPVDSDFENAEEIGSGESRDITLTEDHFAEVYKYTAEKGGSLNIYVNSEDEDFYGFVQIYTKETDAEDTYYNYVISSDRFEYELNAGETIYLRVVENNYRPGSCTLHVDHIPLKAEAVTDSIVNVRKGEEATFGVSARSSESAVHYQWYEETSLNSDEYTLVEGADKDSYTFTADRDCNIKCIVSDDSGNTVPVYFTVFISYGPSEKSFEEAENIEAGDTVQVGVDPEHYAKTFKFVPEKEGAYTVRAVLGENTYDAPRVMVYGNDHTGIPNDQKYDAYPEYLSSFVAGAGETYYIYILSENPVITGSYTLSLTESTDLCAYNRDDSNYITIWPEEEASFEVTAWSASPLHYQWFYRVEDENEENEPSEIPGATEASYTTDSPKSGCYICKVWDDEGRSKEVEFQLHVDNSLYFEEYEKEISCNPGGTALLEADATARDEDGLQFRWQKYDNATEEWVDLSGVSGRTYTTPEVSERTEYRVIVTDRYNNEKYKSFTVGVENNFSAAYVQHENDDKEEVIDDVLTVQFSADDPSYEPKLEVKAEAADLNGVTYRWGCKSGDQSTITLEETGPTCIPRYDGYYFCTVTDRYGNEREVTFRVIIDNDLHFTRMEDTDLEVRGSRAVTLTASAEALKQDSIRYLWFRDLSYDTEFLGETSENHFEVTPESEYERYFCCLTDIYRHYDDSSQVYFNITIIPGIDLSDAEITVAADGLTYDGKAKTPAVTVKYSGNTLTADTDYEVAYSNNTNAGTDTAKVTVTGLGDYEGTVEKTFSIAKASQSLQAEDLSVPFSGTAAIGVTGAQGKVTFTSDAPEVAAVDADGNVTGNKIGTAGIKVSAAGNNNYLPAEKEITVTVTAAELKAEDVTVAANGLTYNGKAQKPAVTVKYGSQTLAENTDYKVSYKNNTNAGTNTAEVTIAGMDNFKGSVTKKFSIAKAAQKLTASAVKTPVGKTATISVTGAKGTKTFKSANSTIAAVNSKTGVVTGKKVGTVKITVTSAATSNYKAASKTVTATVLPAATTKITAENLATGIKVTWNKVTGANGYILYRNNAKIATLSGNAKVTYTDSKANTNGTKYTYKVVAKASTGTSTLSKSLATYRLARPAVSSLTNSAAGKMTVKWAKNAKATGYQIQYTTDSGFKSGVKTVKITKAATVSTVIAKLTKTKTYHVRMRTYKTVGSTSYYSTWSASKRLKITK